MDTIGHAPAIVGREQRRIEGNFQKFAQTAHDFVRSGYQILVADQAATRRIDSAEKLGEIAMGRGPYLFRQSVRIGLLHADQLVHAHARKGLDHRIRMPDQADVLRVVEQGLGAVQRFPAAGISGGLIDQQASPRKALQQRVCLRDRSVGALEFLDGAAALVGAIAGEFHQRALKAFVEPEASQLPTALPHGGEGEKMKLRRNSGGMPGQHDAKQRRAGAWAGKKKDSGRIAALARDVRRRRCGCLPGVAAVENIGLGAIRGPNELQRRSRIAPEANGFHGGDTWQASASAPAHIHREQRRNPPAVFRPFQPTLGLHSASRHARRPSRLFCPPELHLLPFSTVGQRSRLLGRPLARRRFSARADGTHRRRGRPEPPRIEELESADAPISEAYALLQSLARGACWSIKPPIIPAAGGMFSNRAEALFESPKYIHLVRHPYAVVESFARMRMHKLIGMEQADPHRLAEQIWTASHRNLTEFFGGIDPARRCLIRYEDLVTRPDEIMRGLCEFLEIAFDPSLLTPYDGRRMTDGVHSQSLGVGDPGFLARNRINPSLADAWRSAACAAPLGEAAKAAAADLGYDFPAGYELSEAAPPLRNRFLPRRIAKVFVETRGLRLCICEWVRKPARPSSASTAFWIRARSGAPSPVDWLRVRVSRRRPGFAGTRASQHATPSAAYHLLDILADLDDLTNGSSTSLSRWRDTPWAGLAAVSRCAAVPRRVPGAWSKSPHVPGASDRHPADALSLQLDYLSSPAPHPVFPDLKPQRTDSARPRPRCPLSSRCLWPTESPNLPRRRQLALGSARCGLDRRWTSARRRFEAAGTHYGARRSGPGRRGGGFLSAEQAQGALREAVPGSRRSS